LSGAGGKMDPFFAIMPERNRGEKSLSLRSRKRKGTFSDRQQDWTYDFMDKRGNKQMIEKNLLY